MPTILLEQPESFSHDRSTAALRRFGTTFTCKLAGVANEHLGDLVGTLRAFSRLKRREAK